MAVSDARPFASPLIAVVHGTTGIFMGVGLARFSFTPLIPLLIRDGWYTATEAQLLGAWGLAGYLLGGVLAQRVARWLPPGVLSAVMAACVVVSFLVCSFPVSYPLAAFWRLAAGMAGAVLMIAGTAEAAARLAEMGAGNRSGLLFTGVGAGAVVAAVLMPAFESAPVGQASMALTVISAVSLAVHVWAGLMLPPRQTPRVRTAAPRDPPRVERAILWVLFAYGMDALGGTPHAVYLVDYAAREVGIAARWGSLAWAGFGVGAILGPLVMMRFHHRWGLAAFLAKSGCVVLVALTGWPPAFVLSGFVVGFCTPGVAVLIARFIQRAASPRAFIRYWAWATIAFALMQAVGGFAASRLSDALGSYRPVFVLASVALLLGAGAFLLADRALHRAGRAG